MDTSTALPVIVGHPILTGRWDYLEWARNYDCLVKQLKMEKYASPRLGIEDPAPNIEHEKPVMKTAYQLIQELDQKRTQEYNVANAAWSEQNPNAAPDDPRRPQPPANAVFDDIEEYYFVLAEEYKLLMENWEILLRKGIRIFNWISQTVEGSILHEAMFAANQENNYTIQFLVEKLRETCRPSDSSFRLGLARDKTNLCR
ncbi:hypothetical protein MBM_08784 [Drepanopeziza brunnea f. sp. 'multigermtubi' MB_m1]|uniref:Uncharacterized protein n=1 Tax=Marssonina brunnea f. sp. multigermtubi (strain MB_m1) TaxID=1072389 RepID=K1WL84_MARBU|nr:uncharacterized protein MBM_08784 [Drepanopeziza brunnea f. sp. 'multigermtubi' MB_m1]EKD13022.1 hypothetical protein MBM_08784 [Drepanopeziza brunnea f. sp. 'multigermtubi' MB_m1]